MSGKWKSYIIGAWLGIIVSLVIVGYQIGNLMQRVMALEATLK
jgi:hypothetical protein